MDAVQQYVKKKKKNSNVQVEKLNVKKTKQIQC